MFLKNYFDWNFFGLCEVEGKTDLGENDYFVPFILLLPTIEVLISLRKLLLPNWGCILSLPSYSIGIFVLELFRFREQYILNLTWFNRKRWFMVGIGIGFNILVAEYVLRYMLVLLLAKIFLVLQSCFLNSII